MSNDKYLTVALTKGRLAKNALALFARAGIRPEGIDDPSSRKLLFTDEERKMRFFLAKGPDVPAYVAHGAADIGVTGLDTILEEGLSVYEVLDLGFGKCRMCVCGPASAKELLEGTSLLKVATKYPKIARDYFFEEQHRNVEIIKLSGSMELSPLVGLSDVIVDIVETGRTLKENGLAVLAPVRDLSARLIVNEVSMKMEYERISSLIRDLREVITHADRDDQ